jgi:phosphoribosyl 1,2-cyclic phosphodiesterase
MVLTVLGSGSSGNCYLLHNKEECLVIEAGIPFQEVKKSLNFDIRHIVGVIVSHCHGDHSKYCEEYPRAGIPIFKAYEIMTPRIDMGNFLIKPFKLEHDAECYGFYLYQKEMGYLVFATDTYYVKYHFSGVNHILVECNYKQSILDDNFQSGSIHKALRDRTMKSHFELQNVKTFLEKNNSHHLKSVVLLHLSDRNSDAGLFQKECQNVTHKPTYIAEPGLKVNLDLVPF